MDLGLSGRVALVTGASRGIGRAIADGLAAEGARVAVTARDVADAHPVADAIGGHALAFDSDDLDAIGPLADAVERALGPVDVYVANTGGPPTDPDPLSFSRADWERASRTLVASPLALVARLLPGMRERGFGRIVAVSSSAAVEPLPNLQLSNAFRPGLLNAFKHLAREAAGDGVTLNAVLPGRIATDRIAANSGGMDIAQARARTEVPAGRLGTPAELAAAAVFLCSAPASYVTGQSLRVDGGLTRST